MRIKVAQYQNRLSYLSSAFDLADSDSVQFLDVVRSAATLAAAAAELAEVTVAPRKNWKNIFNIFHDMSDKFDWVTIRPIKTKLSILRNENCGCIEDFENLLIKI
jgi:hypothetical protein